MTDIEAGSCFASKFSRSGDSLEGIVLPYVLAPKTGNLMGCEEPSVGILDGVVEFMLFIDDIFPLERLDEFICEVLL